MPGIKLSEALRAKAELDVGSIAWECDDCGREGNNPKPPRCPGCGGHKIIKLEAASDNARFDPHSTDPMRLAAEVRKDLGVSAEYGNPQPGDVRLVYDRKEGKPAPAKVKRVDGDSFTAIDQAGENIRAVWDPRNKRWMRYGKVSI